MTAEPAPPFRLCGECFGVTHAAMPVCALCHFDERTRHSREGETRAHSFAELTGAEAREVAFRGFPRGADVRYFLKPGADAAKEFALTRWTRVAS